MEPEVASSILVGLSFSDILNLSIVELLNNYKPMPFVKNDPRINRKGAPKRAWTWRSEIMKALERRTLDDIPMKQGVAEALVDKALQGDVHALRELGNRLDGLPKQSIEHSSDAERPLRITIVEDRPRQDDDM